MALGTIRPKIESLMVRIIRPVIILRVAVHTGGRSTRKSGFVAFQAQNPQVCSRQWEISGIMVEDHIRIPGRMTCKTGRIRVKISRHAGVFIIRLWVCMTVYTLKLGKISRGRMTIYALTPLALMLATINWKMLTIVVKGGWNPGILGVTLRAVRGKQVKPVVRVRSTIVIFLMASCAGIRRIIVIAVVTLRALHGYRGMRSV